MKNPKFGRDRSSNPRKSQAAVSERIANRALCKSPHHDVLLKKTPSISFASERLADDLVDDTICKSSKQATSGQI